MKTLMRSLIAVVSVALSSAVFAAGEQDHQITGTIVKMNPGATGIVIDDGESDGGAYVWSMRDTKYGTKPKMARERRCITNSRAAKYMLLRSKRLVKPRKGPRKIEAAG
jgi:hypothetical protein